jgi:hypothetical protein
MKSCPQVTSLRSSLVPISLYATCVFRYEDPEEEE